jgi:hypothetical protein
MRPSSDVSTSIDATVCGQNNPVIGGLFGTTATAQLKRRLVGGALAPRMFGATNS